MGQSCFGSKVVMMLWLIGMLPHYYNCAKIRLCKTATSMTSESSLMTHSKCVVVSVETLCEPVFSLLLSLLSLFCYVVDVSVSFGQWGCNVRPIAFPRVWGWTKYVVTSLHRCLCLLLLLSVNGCTQSYVSCVQFVIIHTKSNKHKWSTPKANHKGYCKGQCCTLLLSVHLLNNKKITISLISLSISLLCFHKSRPLLLSLKPRTRDQLKSYSFCKGKRQFAHLPHNLESIPYLMGSF